MEHILSWETSSSSVSQNILYILWNKIGYILEWRKLTTFINHNIILPSMPRSFLSFRFLLTSSLYTIKEDCVTCQPTTVVLHGRNFKSLVNAKYINTYIQKTKLIKWHFIILTVQSFIYYTLIYQQNRQKLANKNKY
jgi:UDP-2,3-diacylglucosamine pyrophosphatase LpxH